MNELRLQTPEGVSFSFLLAGTVSRMLAFVVEAAAVSAIAQGFSLLAGAFQWISADWVRASVIVGYFAVSIFYGIVLEYAWRGQTLGKRLLRLRVVDCQGLRLTPSQVAMRNLLRFVDMLPVCYLVGGVACLFSRRRQRLGDVAANTVVIRQPRLRAPDLDAADLPKFNSLRSHPHLAARLRQRISPREAALLLEALLRREEFDPAARLELFRQLAEHCQGLVAFPPEATESLADEQVVRNVVDVVFEKGGQ